MNSQIKSLGKQAGYTLIELSIAIAIISVLIMTALFGVQKVLDNSNTDTTAQQVTLANASINKYAVMLSDKTFVGTTAAAAGLGIWPDNLVTKTAGVVTKVSNPFGGEYVHLNGGTAGYYYIVITGVPLSACVATAASFANTAAQIDMDEEPTSAKVITNAKPTTVVTAVKPLGGAVAQATLIKACSSATAKKVNVWLSYAM